MSLFGIQWWIHLTQIDRELLKEAAPGILLGITVIIGGTLVAAPSLASRIAPPRSRTVVGVLLGLGFGVLIGILVHTLAYALHQGSLVSFATHLSTGMMWALALARLRVGVRCGANEEYVWTNLERLPPSKGLNPYLTKPSDS